MGFKAFSPPATATSIGSLLTVDRDFSNAEVVEYSFAAADLAGASALMINLRSPLQVENAQRVRFYEWEPATPEGLTVTVETWVEVTRAGTLGGEAVWRLPAYLPLFGGPGVLRVTNMQSTDTAVAFDVFGIKGGDLAALRRPVSKTFGDFLAASEVMTIDIPTVPPGYSGLQVTAAGRSDYTVDLETLWAALDPDTGDDLVNLAAWIDGTGGGVKQATSDADSAAVELTNTGSNGRRFLKLKVV